MRALQQFLSNYGKNDTVVDLFVSMAALGEQWDWYSLYKDWLSQCELVNEWNDNRIEDGDGVVPDERPLPVMPVRPVEVTVEQWKVSNYKILREIAYGSYQTQFDKLYVSDAEWLDYQNLIKDQYPDK